ncbi:hypothetical protein MXD60_18745 [Frankia sp. AgB32]|nr:hypothetical protein [Frankia sp. AgB32]
MENQPGRFAPETIGVSLVLMLCTLAIFGSSRVLSGPWIVAAQIVGMAIGGVFLVLLGVLVQQVRR